MKAGKEQRNVLMLMPRMMQAMMVITIGKKERLPVNGSRETIKGLDRCDASLMEKKKI